MGAMFRSRFQRTFPKMEAKTFSDGYIEPVEVVDADEQSVIDALVEATVSDTRARPQGAGKRDRDYHEPHWGHTTGMLQGTLEIDGVDALPERFRVGLFAAANTYPVVARPNFFHDPQAKLGASRLAMKLRYPTPVPNVYAESGQASELDLLFAEGEAKVNGSFHAFPLRDARQMLMFTKLAPPSATTLALMLDPRNWGMIGAAGKIAGLVSGFFPKTSGRRQGWSGKHYFALGPFRLGDGAMKLALRPLQDHSIDSLNLDGAAMGQRAAMEAWMAAGADARFELCVQLATEASIPAPGPNDPPKEVMVAEYCDLHWDETISPFIRVGELRFPCDQREFDSQYPWSPLQFNAWNTLPSMEPLGQLFRARRSVHKGHCEVRLKHLYEAELGAHVDNAPYATDAEG